VVTTESCDPGDARYGIWMPAPAMRDLLRALLDIAPPTPAAMALLRQGLAPDAEPGLRRLIPLALARPWAATLDPAWHAQAADEGRRAAVRALAFQHFAERMIRGLNAERIEVLLLKGYPLGQLVYDDPSHRPAADLDLLVHPEDVGRARAWFEGQGFRPIAEVLDPRVSHALCLRHGQERFEIDLHWKALYCARWTHADDGFWRRAVRFDTPAGTALTLSPSDHLIHACLHGREGNLLSPFRWIVDAGQILRRQGGRLDWALVIEVAMDQRYPGPLAGCLRYLREVIGLPIPVEVVDRLEAAPMPAADRIFFRLRRSGGLRSGLLSRAAALILLYGRHRHASGGGALGFFEWLRLRWHLDAARELPLATLRRSLASLRRPPPQ